MYLSFHSVVMIFLFFSFSVVTLSFLPLPFLFPSLFPYIFNFFSSPHWSGFPLFLFVFLISFLSCLSLLSFWHLFVFFPFLSPYSIRLSFLPLIPSSTQFCLLSLWPAITSHHFFSIIFHSSFFLTVSFAILIFFLSLLSFPYIYIYN